MDGSYKARITAIPLVPVQIDIKPGTTRNPINMKAGTIPVALLSSASFNAPVEVDIASLRFGRTGTEQSLVKCDGTPEDVNGDGLKDLICHFDVLAAAFQAGDALGKLKGMTTVGHYLLGGDSMVLVP